MFLYNCLFSVLQMSRSIGNNLIYIFMKTYCMTYHLSCFSEMVPVTSQNICLVEKYEKLSLNYCQFLLIWRSELACVSVTFL